jgi:hypothetical protein
MAARPRDVIRGHPRLSNVFNLEHFESDSKELSVMSIQYDILIISSPGQPREIARMPKSVIPADLNKATPFSSS